MWSVLAQPLLFGAIGTELNFHRMEAITILKSISGWDKGAERSHTFERLDLE